MLKIDQVIMADVVVVGAGNAGLRAAVAAASQGAETVVVSKSPFPGGSSCVAGGFHQASFGADDSEDLHFRDTIKGGYYLGNQRLIRILVREAKERILDLEQMGGAFYRVSPQSYSLTRLGGYSVARGVETGRTERIARILRETAYHLSVPVFEECMVTKLLTDAQGRVCGVFALDIRWGRGLVFLGKCVVLASGAIGRLYRRTATPRNATGDGFGLAMNLGVEMLDMEFMQFIPLSYVYPSFIEGMTLGEASVYGARTKYLNSQGERFIVQYDPERLERTTRDIGARSIYIEVREGRGTPHGGVWLDNSENRPEEGAYQPHRLRHRWKLIRDFYGIKKANYQEPMEVAPSALYICGGLEINEECRTSLPGLFACGEISGNMHGANRLGGNSLIELQVYGRRAGEFAAQEAKGLPLPPVDTAQVEEEVARLNGLLQSREGTRPRMIKRELQSVMWEHCAIVRDGDGLQKGLSRIQALKEQAATLRLTTDTTNYNYELVEACEVPLMLDLAEVMVSAALHREESRGNHFRADFPKMDNQNWLCHTTIQKGDGRIHIGKKDVELVEIDPRR
ncbi:MAG: FAD-binding protein [Chloroflexi bacterium]|nr:FAD-binding protein [Chloroflexota bacterium]